MEWGWLRWGYYFVAWPSWSVVSCAGCEKQASCSSWLPRFYHCFIVEPRSTFVEKLYAVRGAYLSNKARGKTRHYYDLYAMSKCDEVKEFIGTLNYYGCVEEVRQLCHDSFPTQPLPDENSFQSSPALCPEGEGLRELERNWKAEQDLYLSQQPPLADVLRTLGKLLPKL